MNDSDKGTIRRVQSFACAALTLGTLLVLGTAHAKPRDEPRTLAPPPDAPVLVELFTSEGCSSCPPADALLARIGAEASALRGDVIVLSEHVTYWNYLGWSDPYSSKISTDRQNEYARHFGIDGPYTPQMVVAGRTQFVGSDSAALRQALSRDREAERPMLSVAVLSGSGSAESAGSLRVLLKTGTLPRAARLIVVLVERNGKQQVSRGENGGRVLEHVSIAREFQEVGLPAGGKPMETERSLELPRGASAADYRVVTFLQEGRGGPILAAASTK